MVIRAKVIANARHKDVDAVRLQLIKLMVDVTAEGQRFIAKYPAQTLRKTGYRRTGTLKRSWSTKVTTTSTAIKGVIGSNDNIAPYNKFVQGRPQSKLFRTTAWRNIDQLQLKAQNELRNRSAKIVEHFARN